MFTYGSIMLFLLFGAAACSPAASNVTDPPTAEPNEITNDEPEPEADAEHESEGEHEEEHRVGFLGGN